MECDVCRNVHRKFFCASCIRKRIRTHNAELKQFTLEKQRHVDKATKFVNGSMRSIQTTLAEKHAVTQKLKTVEFETDQLRDEIGRDRLKLDFLKKNLQKRRQVLQESLAYFKKFQMHQKATISKDIANTKERWRHVHTVLTKSRTVLIGELVSLFDLKRIPPNELVTHTYHNGVRENGKQFVKGNGLKESVSMQSSQNGTSVEDDGEYSIAGRMLPKKCDFVAYPQDEINTTVGHAIHLLGLVAYYLGVRLPFIMIRDKNSNPYARNSLPGQHLGKQPLFITDHNVEHFTIGMAMVNYNIAYLCYTQGVEIPFQKVPYTLQNLYLCCHSPDLGRYSNLTSSLTTIEQNFVLDFEQLVRMMFARRDGEDGPIIYSVHDATLYDNYFYGEDDDEIDDNNETWDLVEMVV